VREHALNGNGTTLDRLSPGGIRLRGGEFRAEATFRSNDRRSLGAPVATRNRPAGVEPVQSLSAVKRRLLVLTRDSATLSIKGTTRAALRQRVQQLIPMAEP
jgi:hypothetical protein